ncbi:hypothetical protein [Salipaludibacillus aurantiacus]|uniref:Uncharacterized protein n=1 Tax=Salipaludibacillus aurantiacus TaxID=1601833 RepID=A0A1H9W1V1_9BACI|nr:hypothetical protein [Salipaludibacillus aurantiacus]SES27885.1 hypothetical protein SAMN05518684_1141 [Salipaludibacillus aurantiacus]
MEKQLVDILEEQGIDDLSNLTEKDIKKVPEVLELITTKFEENELDQALIQEFYKFVSNNLPNIFNTLINLVSQHLGKETMETFNKRIDALNKRYEKEEDIEILKLITQEITDILDRVERETEKQRAWLSKLAFGALGTVAVVGGITVGVKNKELGKKIANEGLKYLKG